ncbi:MAG: hypothetical protein ACLSB9_37355 [Hydrogeniiclostridium mannosilyticum]
MLDIKKPSVLLCAEGFYCIRLLLLRFHRYNDCSNFSLFSMNYHWSCPFQLQPSFPFRAVPVVVPMASAKMRTHWCASAIGGICSSIISTFSQRSAYVHPTVLVRISLY